jgi:hypothetical protein
MRKSDDDNTRQPSQESHNPEIPRNGTLGFKSTPIPNIVLLVFHISYFSNNYNYYTAYYSILQVSKRLTTY